MRKLSVFAPSIMRDKLSASDFCRRIPYTGEFGGGDFYSLAPESTRAEYWDELRKGEIPFDALFANDREYILRRSKRDITGWFNSVLQLALYADEVWIPSVFLGHRHVDTEPSFEDWFRTPSPDLLGVHDEYFAAWNEFTFEFRAFFHAIEPLVRCGIIRIYNPAKIFWEAVAEPLLGEQRWMTGEEIEGCFPDLFVAEGLLFAQNLNVPYTATNIAEIDAINRSLDGVELVTGRHQAVLQMTATSTLPGLDLTPNSLVAARQDNEAFQAFRSILRRMSYDLPKAVDTNDQNQDMAFFENDILRPEIERLQSEITKSGVISRSIKPNAISFSAGAFSSLLLKADPTTALASGALTTLGRIILSEIFDRKRTTPEARFVNYFSARV